MVSSSDAVRPSAMEERLAEVGRRLARHRTKKVWIKPPPDGEYRAERPAPDGARDYTAGKPEPLVDLSDLYRHTGRAFLTVNAYDALVLNSPDLLIADIDFGNRRLDPHAGAANLRAVRRALSRLEILDEYIEDRYRSIDRPEFCRQSYSVYRTAAGCRVVCTSRPFPWDRDGWLALKLMRFLGADPQYMRLCELQKCYRARLTPKPWRDFAGHGRACRIAKIHRPDVPDQVLWGQLLLHDEISGTVVYPVCAGAEAYLA